MASIAAVLDLFQVLLVPSFIASSPSCVDREAWELISDFFRKMIVNPISGTVFPGVLLTSRRKEDRREHGRQSGRQEGWKAEWKGGMEGARE